MQRQFADRSDRSRARNQVANPRGADRSFARAVQGTRAVQNARCYAAGVCSLGLPWMVRRISNDWLNTFWNVVPWTVHYG